MLKSKFAIPNNLDLPKLLHEKYPNFESHLYKFYYIIDHLLENRFLNHRYSAFKKVQKNSAKKKYVPLSSQILKKMIGDAYYADILRILREEEIIDCDDIYVHNEKSKGYVLMPLYINSNFHYIQCEPSKTINNFLRKYEKKRKADYDKMTPIQNQIRLMLTNIKYDLENAQVSYEVDKNILNIRQINSLRMHLHKLKENDFFFSVDKYTGRIFHNYDIMRKEYRRFILDEDNNSMIEIDIANSQPFFLSLLIKSISNSYQYFSDLVLYENLTLNAKFYQYVFDHTSNDFNKEDILIFMYSPLKKENRLLRNFFQEHFPTLYTLMKTIKLDSYRDLSIDLQKLEAEMMINTVAPILLSRNILFVPIHDSVMISSKYKDEVMSIIKDEFKKKYNIVPVLKVK